jgi:hypothetical protein
VSQASSTGKDGDQWLPHRIAMPSAAPALPVLIRQVTADDRPALAEMLARCSDQTRERRFHKYVRCLPEPYLTEALAGCAGHFALLAQAGRYLSLLIAAFTLAATLFAQEVVGTGAPNAAASNIGGPACTGGWVAAPSPSFLANQISDGQSRLRLYYANPDVDAAYFSSEFGIQWCYQVVGDGLTNGTVAYEFQDPATGLCLTFNKAAYSNSHPGSLDETGCFLTQVVPSERWDIAAGYWPAPYTSVVWIHNQWVEENTNINGSGLGGYADSCLAADAKRLRIRRGLQHLGRLGAAHRLVVQLTS